MNPTNIKAEVITIDPFTGNGPEAGPEARKPGPEGRLDLKIVIVLDFLVLYWFVFVFLLLRSWEMLASLPNKPPN